MEEEYINKNNKNLSSIFISNNSGSNGNNKKHNKNKKIVETSPLLNNDETKLNNYSFLNNHNCLHHTENALKPNFSKDEIYCEHNNNKNNNNNSTNNDTDNVDNDLNKAESVPNYIRNQSNYLNSFKRNSIDYHSLHIVSNKNELPLSSSSICTYTNNTASSNNSIEDKKTELYRSFRKNQKLFTNNFQTLQNSITSSHLTNKKPGQRFKLLSDGEVHVCKLLHSRSVINKILNLRLLRRWKTHRLILSDTEISSATKTDYMEYSIPYASIEDVGLITKWESGQKYCLRIITNESLYLIQTISIYARDQWLHSINWKRQKFKYERLLKSAERPEILVKEIKSMIEISTGIPIEDGEIYQFPLEIISDILQKNNLLKSTHEEVIIALGPLLEKNNPSPEICDFFSRHCRDSPRSQIVIEMFTPVVQRILKHNGDFIRYPRMKQFIQDYLVALISQNGGIHTVQNFVITMHTAASRCPFPRVLPNFVSVCLACICNCFERRKGISKDERDKIQQELDEQLMCYTTMLYTLSSYDDWRLNLGPLLQSIPFSIEFLEDQKLLEIMKKVIKNLFEDNRCEVHQTLLGIREGKEGWLETFCPGSIPNNDDTEFFTLILNKLINCCCKKKRFLLSINKLLSQIMLMALRENLTAIETLCAMLELDAIENRDYKLQVISTLQSTITGTKLYSKVCEKQIQLKELQQKGGPRKLTLPSRSTDEDLAKLLLSGCFGNLECLSLAFTNVTSACAEYLIKLPSLKYLNLWCTQFGDKGLELISEHLHRLQVLNLCETPVTDKGLVCLASLKQLRKLNLNSTHLSALTFESLKERLPALQECDIRYTDAW